MVAEMLEYYMDNTETFLAGILVIFEHATIVPKSAEAIARRMDTDQVAISTRLTPTSTRRSAAQNSLATARKWVSEYSGFCPAEGDFFPAHEVTQSAVRKIRL